MKETMNRKWQRFKYYYKISPVVLVKRLVDKIIAPIYRHEVGYITLTKVPDAPDAPVNPVNIDNGETKCIVLKTPASLNIWEKEISNLIPIIELFSLFGGLYKHVTSWEEVKKVIDSS